MRYLNKIVFINSAHVRYAEINLNGNVHLIGTQGVGKSTLLRALLFFYNADKQKLGIPKEKKSFDDFYFEKDNSYIVYEVVRDESAYCVLVSKSSGRASFHFIDAPYHRDFIVNENGEVPTETKNIRARLNEIYHRPIYMSSTVDRYETFRDIIYGNHQNVKKEFYKFSLAESSRYQNIPRSIQNVFLNSKLDADFIKDTIIQSMDGESAFIDLRYFRNQVSEFEQEYSDIGKWFEKNKKGECVVRIEAERVVNVYHALLLLKKNIETSSKELNYAYRITKEQLPAISSEIEKQEQALNTTMRLLREENDKFMRERDGLKKSLTLTDEKLKNCREKSAYYVSQNIEEVLKKQERESVLKMEKENQEERKRLLTREFESVAEKYERLIQQVNDKLGEFKQVQQARIIESESKLNAEKQNRFAEFEKSKNAASVRFDSEIETANNLKQNLQNEKTDYEKSLIELKYFHPFEKEMQSCKTQMENLRASENSDKLKQANAARELAKVQSQRDSKIADCKSNFEKENHKLASVREKIALALEKLDNLLEKQKGSLYEWLSTNKVGWENSIGKIIDEETVLYHSGLSPELTTEAGESLFGVKLNLEELPNRIRTPEDLQNEHRELEKSLAENSNAVQSLQDDLEKRIASVERSYGTKIKALQEEIRNLEIDLVQIPSKIKRTSNELENFKRKDAEEIEKRRNEIQQKVTEVSQKILAAEENIARIRDAKKREISKIEKSYRDDITAFEKATSDFKIQVKAEILDKENRAKEECDAIQKQKENELESKNVDVNELRKCESEILRLTAELNDIESHRELVTLYRRDKAELFDREAEFKEEKRTLESKLNDLQGKFNSRREKLNAQKFEQETSLNQSNERKKSMENDVSETEKFALSSLCPENIKDAGETPCTKNCSEVIRELTSAVIDSLNRKKDLEKSINKFRDNFSPRNTFKFPSDLNSEYSYIAFAENLNDFLLNNKINDYRERTSGRYTEILTRIAREVGNMTKQKQEVEKIVSGVNRDFNEKNFAGVIKSIALRTEESNDKLMRLLESIQTFNAENQYKMGEINLFSDAGTEEANRKAVELLLQFVRILKDEPNRDQLKLSDAFRLQFRVQENDNDTGWIDKISNVGSEGTDVLVKAMVNIMLINVFKTQISRKFGDFKLHCMMDEIGRLHPTNANGILKFANARNIYLVNGSPTTQSVSEYRYTYLLEKNAKSETVVRPLMTRISAT